MFEKYPYNNYTESDVKAMLEGRQSRYALAIAVAKRAREISDSLEAQAQKDKSVVYEKSVLLAAKEFEENKFKILEPDTDD